MNWRAYELMIPKQSEHILLRFAGGEVSVAYYDLYYAVGGSGYDGTLPFVEPVSGELVALHYGQPTHWMPLPPLSSGN